MWLVLCGSKDLSALWAYQGLKARGLQPVELISAESLVYSPRMEHRIESNNASTRIKLADGRAIDSASIRGTLNRLQSLPTEHLRAANPADRQYAEQELYALFLSWLSALPGMMLNRPAPPGLCGAWRHPSEWTRLALQAGLSAGIYRQSDSRGDAAPVYSPAAAAKNVIVLAGRCFGAPAPPLVQRGCLKLAEICEVELLGVDFRVDTNSHWVFAGATPLPEIRLGGESFLDGLFEVFGL